MTNLHIPQTLQAGDCIGIIAPAGEVRELNDLNTGVAILKAMGFEVKLPTQLWPGKGYLADTDRNRAQEFHRMWADPEVKALMALRGGFGCLRMLPFLDPQEINKENKILIGYSDITVLHAALQHTNSLISFHGPMLCGLSGITEKSRQRLYACLTGRWDKAITETGIEVLRDGEPARGTLIGGNLSTLMSLLATPMDMDWSDKILFLEDVGEPLYRLDRMLTQLWHSGKMEHVKGLILGDFSLSSNQDSLEKIRFHEEIWNRVLELTRSCNMPVWGNFPVGHGRDNLTLPHGAEALMDSNRVRLSFS